MADKPQINLTVIRAYLDDVENELQAVRRLVEPPTSRFAAYHLQQAAEKLIKAVRLRRGLYATKEHNLEVLVHELTGDPWYDRLLPLDSLSAYATTYRYPTPGRGRIKSGPDRDELLSIAEQIEGLLVDARKELLVP